MTLAPYKFVKTEFENTKPEKYVAGKMVKGRNEPCTMIQILEAVAGIQRVDPAALASMVFRNTTQLFFPSIHN